jgi:acyl-CoA dehydrogenase
VNDPAIQQLLARAPHISQDEVLGHPRLGERASNESSMSKVVCSEAIARVADRSMQILGGMGMTRDTVVERIFRDTRAFRIYDGPSEVHRCALGARIVGGKM